MLSFVSRFGSFKGMVAVPNLSGLTKGQAISAIQAAGLTFKSNSPVESSNSSLNDKVSSQEIPFGTLVDYESGISFSYYIYVAPAVKITTGNCENKPGAENTKTEVTCTDYGQNNTETTTTTVQKQALIYADGVSTGTYQACEASVTTTTKSQTANCGYVKPAKTCTASETWDGPWTACQEIFGGGTRVRYKTFVYTDCSSETIKYEEDCCAAVCGSWSSWSSGSPSTRTKTCQKIDCTTYTVTEKKCTAKCTAWGGGSCVKGKKTQSRVCTAANCEKTDETRVVNCTGGAV
jgi:hypothetical protein